MIRLLKIAAVAALCIGVMRAGDGRAAEFSSNSAMSAPMSIAQDTMRDISTTLHSRLDAYRKVVEYYGAAPVVSGTMAVTSEAVPVATFAVPEAYGSAILTVDYDRYMNRFWAGGLGTLQDARARGGVEGWKYKGAGAMLGYDRAFGAAMIGGSIAYVDGNLEMKDAYDSDSKIEQYAANIYAAYNASNGFFGAIMGGYALSENDMDESFAVNGGDRIRTDYRTHTLYGGGKLGYDIEFSDTFNLTPSIGVDYFYSKSNSNNVTLNNAYDGHFGAVKNHLIEIPVDLKAAYEVPMGANKALTLMANVGYAYNVNDKAAYGTFFNGGTKERLTGRNAGHNSWKAGAGARYRMNMWDIGVKYDYLGRSKYQSHRVTGQIGYNF